MRCKQCGKDLPLFKKIADNDFCSVEHRQLFLEAQHQVMLDKLKESGRRMRVRTMAAAERDPLVAPPPDPNPPPRPPFGFLSSEFWICAWLPAAGPASCDPIGYSFVAIPDWDYRSLVGYAGKLKITVRPCAGIRGLRGAVRPAKFEPLLVAPVARLTNKGVSGARLGSLAHLAIPTPMTASAGATQDDCCLPGEWHTGPGLPVRRSNLPGASLARGREFPASWPVLQERSGGVQFAPLSAGLLAAQAEPVFPGLSGRPLSSSMRPALTRLFRMRPRAGVSCLLEPHHVLVPTALEPAAVAATVPLLGVIGLARTPRPSNTMYRMRARAGVSCFLEPHHVLAPASVEPAALAATVPVFGVGGPDRRPSEVSRMYRMRPGKPAGAPMAAADFTLGATPSPAALSCAYPSAALSVAARTGLKSAGRPFRFRPRGGVYGDCAEFELIHCNADAFVGRPVARDLALRELEPRPGEQMFRARPRAGVADSTLAPYTGIDTKGLAAGSPEHAIPGLVCRVVGIGEAPPALTRCLRMRPRSGVSYGSLQQLEILEPAPCSAHPAPALRALEPGARTHSPRHLDRLYKMRPRNGVLPPSMRVPIDYGETLETGSLTPVLPAALSVREQCVPVLLDRLYRMRPRNGVQAELAAGHFDGASGPEAGRVGPSLPPTAAPDRESTPDRAPAVSSRIFRVRPRSGVRGAAPMLSAEPQPEWRRLRPQVAHPGISDPSLTLLERLYRTRPRGIAAPPVDSNRFDTPAEFCVARAIPSVGLPACAPSPVDDLAATGMLPPSSPSAESAWREITTGPVEDSEIFVMPPVPKLHVVYSYELPRADRRDRMGPPSASAGDTEPKCDSVEPFDSAMVARVMLAQAMAAEFELFRTGLQVTRQLAPESLWKRANRLIDRAIPAGSMLAWFRRPALRLATCGACVLTFLIIWSASNSSISSASAVPAHPNEQRETVANTLTTVKRMVDDRAATDLKEDFGTGLAGWEGGPDWSSRWTYDERGGVKPGALAILKPSVKLTDYSFEFLGEIEKNALGFTLRSADVQNYQAVRLVVKTPGPVPVVSIFRYAVVGGKTSARVEKRLPLTVYRDTIYKVRATVKGDTFTLAVNDLVVDDWTEERLAAGGVGFFSPKGDEARVFQVRVYHQTDTIGKALALVAKK